MLIEETRGLVREEEEVAALDEAVVIEVVVVQ